MYSDPCTVTNDAITPKRVSRCTTNDTANLETYFVVTRVKTVAADNHPIRPSTEVRLDH